MPPRSPTGRTATPVGAPNGFNARDAARSFESVTKMLYSSPRAVRSRDPDCSPLNIADAFSPGSRPFTCGMAPRSSRAAEEPVVKGRFAGRDGSTAVSARSTIALASGPSSSLMTTTTADRLCGMNVFRAMKPLTAPPFQPLHVLGRDRVEPLRPQLWNQINPQDRVLVCDPAGFLLVRARVVAEETLRQRAPAAPRAPQR
jgi:hypothetical protein